MTLTQKVLDEIEQIKNLPTKDEFFTTMDKVMGELQDIRDEMTILSGRHKQILSSSKPHCVSSAAALPKKSAYVLRFP